MEQKTPEQNQPKPEVVQLGQKFQLFKPERTSFNKNDGKVKTGIALHIEGLPMLRFELELSPSDKIDPYPVGLTFFPSDPEKGYTVTNEDFDPGTRTEKEDAIKDQPLSPHSLKYLNFVCSFIDRGDSEKEQGDPEFYIQVKRSSIGFRRIFKPKIMETLKRLRFLVLSPKASFEGEPDEGELNVGSIYFTKFYPFDTGPLPKIHEFGSEGIDVSFPTNIEDVQKVNGTFVLAPEELEETQKQ